MTLFYSDSVFGELSSNTSSISQLSLFNNSDSVLVSPEFKVIIENKIRSRRAVAKNHVLLSKKSPVCLTPPSCC